MANNVYIGSRYVPVFDGAWDATKSYEALTIVEYGNNSYTSKRPVPVGTLPTNTTYWALTGNYNGQISALQDQINSNSSNISSINNKINHMEIRNVLDFGAVGDGVTDDTAAIVSAIGSGARLYFPPYHQFKVTEITIEDTNVTFMGGGVIDGIIRIRATWPNNEPINFMATEVTFVGATPIIIDRGISIKIFNCRFFNSDKCITISPTGEYSASTWSHLVEDLNIDSNYVWMCNYFIYGDRGNITGVPQDYLYMGDMNVLNNQVKVAHISHIYIADCDGAIIANNTFYFGGYAGKDPNKLRNIHIYHWSAGVQINDNQLFEAGREGILLYNASRYTIEGNHIVQCGQVNLSSAIKIQMFGAGSGNYGLITGNHIYAPSKFAVELENAQRVTVVDNYVYNPYTDAAYYGEDLGNPAMSSVVHYVVHSETINAVDYSRITAKNWAYDDSALYHGFVNYNEKEIYKTITSGTPTLENGTIWNLNPPSGMTISSIDTSHLNEGAVVTLVAYNVGVVVKNTASIRLHGGVDYNMPINSVLQLKYMTGMLWEIGRTET